MIIKIFQICYRTTRCNNNPAVVEDQAQKTLVRIWIKKAKCNQSFFFSDNEQMFPETPKVVKLDEPSTSSSHRHVIFIAIVPSLQCLLGVCSLGIPRIAMIRMSIFVTAPFTRLQLSEFFSAQRLVRWAERKSEIVGHLPKGLERLLRSDVLFREGHCLG